MKQYRITTEHLNQASPEDCVLPPNDPIHEIKSMQYLAGLGHAARLHEYQGSNISVTGNEKGRIQREKNIQPGTPEWFQLWFSLPYMTGEKPVKGSKK
jgi:hypothetical protein